VVTFSPPTVATATPGAALPDPPRPAISPLANARAMRPRTTRPTIAPTLDFRNERKKWSMNRADQQNIGAKP